MADDQERYEVALYDGGSQPERLCAVRKAASEREARRIAAWMLGHRNLRGARTWEAHRVEGTVYMFGPNDGWNDYVIISEATR